MTDSNAMMKASFNGLVANGHSRSKITVSLEATISTFCKELPTVSCRAVHHAVSEIGGLQRQIVINMLAIGDHLNKLRARIGSQKFHQFMSEVLPLLGISRSTGYRWLGFAEKLAPVFPNPLIRQHLMSLTDGKGIVARLEKKDAAKPDVQDVILTPAASAALKRLPPPPKSQHDSAKCEQWVRRFIKAVGKARSEARSAVGHNVMKDRVAIVRRFKRFASRYGLQTAEDLCGFLDKILTQIASNEEPESRTMPASMPGASQWRCGFTERSELGTGTQTS